MCFTLYVNKDEADNVSEHLASTMTGKTIQTFTHAYCIVTLSTQDRHC